jgi:transporter family protein
MWIILSLLSALFAGITATVVKGVSKEVDSTLGFGVQAVVILVCTWIVIAVQGKAGDLVTIDGKSWLFLAITGVITTFAYLFYFGALKMGNASQVAPLDRLSLIFAIVFAAMFLKEKLTPQIIAGGLLMAFGAVMIAMSKSNS